MSQRPTIVPGLLADISSAAPGRVQKKLDKEPNAAEDWDWQPGDAEWKIIAGEETVTLRAGGVEVIEHLSCTCLLGPRCFHVLAVLSRLEIGGDAPVADTPAPAAGGEDEEPVDDFPVLTNTQRQAAQAMFAEGGALLSAGLRAAGTVLQSRLLRAIHECRAEGLHRLAAAGIRLMQNIRLLRDGQDEFDSATAVADLLETLEVAWQLLKAGERSELRWVGVARRRYAPMKALKLHGLFSEPILTRSGYSGCVTYMMADDGWIGSISDVQPGDASRIPQAWKTSVRIGSLALSHRDLSRQSMLVQKGTRSADGRLGGGDSARAVTLDGQGWEAPPIAARFSLPPQDQIEEHFRHQSLPAFLRPPDSEFLFFTGTVLGCAGPDLLFQEATTGSLLRAGIAIDSEKVPFRASLTMLGRSPGLRLRCIGRIDAASAGRVLLLAIAPMPELPDTPPEERPPQLLLSEKMSQHADIGLDEITRTHLDKAERDPVRFELPSGDTSTHSDDALARWLRAVVVGGRHALPPGQVTSAVRDARRLKAAMRPTAAALLQTLTRSAIDTESDFAGIRFPADPTILAQHWLAAAVAERATLLELMRRRWLSVFGSG